MTWSPACRRAAALAATERRGSATREAAVLLAGCCHAVRRLAGASRRRMPRHALTAERSRESTDLCACRAKVCATGLAIRRERARQHAIRRSRSPSTEISLRSALPTEWPTTLAVVEQARDGALSTGTRGARGRLRRLQRVRIERPRAGERAGPAACSSSSSVGVPDPTGNAAAAAAAASPGRSPAALPESSLRRAADRVRPRPQWLE